MKYQYWFARVTGMGNLTKHKLLQSFGSARQIFEADKWKYLETGFIKEDMAEYLIQQKKMWDLAGEYEQFLEKKIGFVTMEMEEYPLNLKDIYNAPYALYYRGTLPKHTMKMVAMVGARRPSAYGRTMAGEIAKALAKVSIGVVSGMARGIDGASHEGCLQAGGQTYAFLGSGVDVIYPKEHSKLYCQIIEQGAVLSDYPPGSRPLAEHFPARNRLISGMSDKTIVIEAKKKSGSLITADLAMDQGRDVLALPGRITDVMSEGTNHLIEQGAGIISSVDSLINDLNDLAGLENISSKGSAFENLQLEKEEMLVYSCFDFYAKGMEEVRQECGMDMVPFLSAVSSLCELGLIREIFKNQYIRLG